MADGRFPTASTVLEAGVLKEIAYISDFITLHF
jgi:hypothetical protein